jgi:hypothetical protein
LLLLESGRTPSTETHEGSEVSPVHDLAVASFPADSDQMGVRADVLALSLTAIGLMTVAGFIAHERGRA